MIVRAKRYSKSMVALAIVAVLIGCNTTNQKQQPTDIPDVVIAGGLGYRPTNKDTKFKSEFDRKMDKANRSQPSLENTFNQLGNYHGGHGRHGYSRSWRRFLQPHRPVTKPWRNPRPQVNTEKYQKTVQNPVKAAAESPLSTFSVDVDTGSYSNVRRFLAQQSRLPAKDAVRVEELINYFDYQYPVPKTRKTPFRIYTEVNRTPWNKHSYLLHIGLKGYSQPQQQRKPMNLVFLIDVSGSMQSPNKLGLVKRSLKLLAKQLRVRDRVAIVVYAGSTGVVLQSTRGLKKQTIIKAIDKLEAGGSTNGGAGIQLAYKIARQNFKKDGINRVILATDGDFNVGTVDHNQLIDMIKKQRASGVFLTTLGFGSGNYNDKLMEQLANKGNGNYAYIDSMKEARKVFGHQLSSNLVTIAKDVKIQVEFNPAVVAEYRLIGYENRKLKREDFTNDKVDAGEIGAGHTVTAIYEITLKGSKGRRLPKLRYANEKNVARMRARELAFVKLRYKLPGQSKSREMRKVVMPASSGISLKQASRDFRFAASVAAFGQLLRGGQYMNGFTFKQARTLARSSLGQDKHGYRKEYLKLAQKAESISKNNTALNQ